MQELGTKSNSDPDAWPDPEDLSEYSFGATGAIAYPRRCSPLSCIELCSCDVAFDASTRAALRVGL